MEAGFHCRQMSTSEKVVSETGMLVTANNTTFAENSETGKSCASSVVYYASESIGLYMRGN